MQNMPQGELTVLVGRPTMTQERRDAFTEWQRQEQYARSFKAAGWHRCADQAKREARRLRALFLRGA